MSTYSIKIPRSKRLKIPGKSRENQQRTIEANTTKKAEIHGTTLLFSPATQSCFDQLADVSAPDKCPVHLSTSPSQVQSNVLREIKWVAPTVTTATCEMMTDNNRRWPRGQEDDGAARIDAFVGRARLCWVNSRAQDK